MPGLAAYALAGALGGAGEGLAEMAAAASETALAKLKAQYRQDEAAQDRQWELDDRALEEAARAAPAGRRASGGAAPARSSVPRSSASEASAGVVWESGTPYAEPGARVVSRYQAEDGSWRGFVGGQEVFLRGPDSQPIRGGDPDRNPQLAPQAMAEPPAMAAPAGSGPKAGAVVDGYRFKGGDPNDETNWEKV